MSWSESLTQVTVVSGVLRTLRILALAGALFISWRMLDGFFFSPLHGIPGPLAARLPPLRAIYTRLPNRVITAALADFNTYGNLYISEPKTVTISKPRDVRVVLSAPGFQKIDVYRGLKDLVMANIVTFHDATLASRRRRQIGPYFNPSYLAKMEPLILRNGIQASRPSGIGCWTSMASSSR